MASLADFAIEIGDQVAGSHHLQILPLFHLGGFGQCLQALLTAGTVHIHTAFDPAAAIDAIEADRIEFFTAGPSLIDMLVAEVRRRGPADRPARPVQPARDRLRHGADHPVPADRRGGDVRLPVPADLRQHREPVHDQPAAAGRSPAGPSAAGQRGQGLIRLGGARRRSRRPRPAARHTGRAAHPRRVPVLRLLARRRCDRRGLRRRRLVPHRRRRPADGGRLSLHPRPGQGHDHQRRREHLSRRGRGRARRPPGGRRRGGGRPAGRQVGRGRARGDHPAGRAGGRRVRRRDHRLVPGAARALQVPQERGVHRLVPAHHHRQGAQARAAGSAGATAIERATKRWREARP